MNSSPGYYGQRGYPNKRATEISDPNKPDMSDKQQSMRGAAKNTKRTQNGLKLSSSFKKEQIEHN
jgi:hypothetical protein